MKNLFLIILLFHVPNIFGQVDWARTNSCEYKNFNNSDLIEQLIVGMTVEEKVGQVIQGDLDFISPEDVKKFKIGSVLNGGNTAPNGDKYSSVNDWKKLSKEFYDASPTYKGIKVPVLWGTDAVHGHNNVIGATLFPHNIGLGATGNEDLIRSIGEVIALEVLSTGVAWTFAPTIAVPQDDRWGRTYEGFSEDPILVSKLGKAFVLGLQGEGETLLDNNHVIATAKHFMGDGGTFEGIDQGNTRISEIGLRELHGYPYFDALDACAQTVMASFNSWNGQKLHGYERLLTDILKKDMQFDGFVVGDWNGHGQVEGCSNAKCAQSFNAGVDMFMVPENWKDLLRNTIKQVKSGEISEARLNDAVRNILTVKSRLGLFNGRVPHEFKENYLGHPKHIALARQAVRESLVLLKNNNRLLPLNPKQHIGIIGDAAKKISSQTGGWTITWQGRENLNSDFVNVNSIYEALEKTILLSGGTVEFSNNGKFIKDPDVVIGVFGEEPYAEMLGDLKDVAFAATDPKFLPLLEAMNAQSIPTISIFLSGRPLVVNRQLNASDAFIAAWLPGSAVEGIADVIFTKDDEINYDFTGKLSYSWPKNKDQSVLNFTDSIYDPLFPYGYGLSYSSNVKTPRIQITDNDSKLDLVNVFLGTASIPGKEFVRTKAGPEFVLQDDFVSNNDKIKITRFDYQRQDDAKNVVFKEDQYLQAFGISAESHVNLSTMKSPFYEIIMRVNSLTNPSLYFSVGCGNNCRGSIKLPTKLMADWSTINIPLSCLEKDGLDKTKIQVRGLFLSEEEINFDLNSIVIKDGKLTGKEVGC
ncbi:glycoside hydrolase family 3 N-terminal domain-containing protein [Gammaproteobacteria bacterium]|nr:glycoside hydrolase family 3 N-terminal domain-containing protein [Gammaproteobacteria bacterium]MDC1131625.1 glycoside hydrolase family 3 N-terminal domain-containing protein [Gammaproteobacteria bacterium]